MRASLVQTFGAAAYSIAVGQPGERDVGGKSGIQWRELANALREGNPNSASAPVATAKVYKRVANEIADQEDREINGMGC